MYDSVLETQGPDEKAMDTVALVSRKYFQLKSEHAVTGCYLRLIGKVDSD